MTARVLAVDVTEEARAQGCSTPGTIAVSAGVAGALAHTDDATWRTSLGQLARLVLEAPEYVRRRFDEARELVTNRHGRRWMVIRSAADDGAPRVLICWALEWGLADGEVVAEVLQRDVASRRLN